MAKLYAEVNSDKGGRVVGKGGNDSIAITIKARNRICYDIVITEDGRGKAPAMKVTSEHGDIFKN